MFSNIINTFSNCFKIPELKSRILFTVLLLSICRVVAIVHVPGLNGGLLHAFLMKHQMGNGLLGMYSMFTGGALDRVVLKALRENDAKALTAIPEDRFRAGTSEIKNWIPVSAIMAERGLPMTLVDYVPCYRSEAGTGNALGFAVWE